MCVSEQIITESYLNLRYEGTDCALMCTAVMGNSETSGLVKHGDFESVFISRLHSFAMHRHEVYIGFQPQSCRSGIQPFLANPAKSSCGNFWTRKAGLKKPL